MNDFLTGVFERLHAQFHPEAMGQGLASMMANVAVAVGTFAVFYLVWRLFDRVVQAILQRSRVDETTAVFVKMALKYILLTLGVVQGLAAAGINTAAILASLGLAGLTIGFAARDALSNLISGVLIYWDRPFVIGDLVEVGGSYGRVERITLRSTRIVTVDGKMLAVPNATIINSTVASYTNFPHLRLDVSVTVAVTEDLDRAREVLLSVARNNPAFLDDPAPQVVVAALNDYNVALQLQVWLRDERTHIPERFALREQMFKALRAAGIDMPFETIQLAPITLKNGASGAGSTIPETVS